MANYCMTVDGQDYELRLTAKAQKKLEDKFGKSVTAILLDCIDRVGIRVEVFQAALNYDGNHNPITDGYDFCDALMDDGIHGGEELTAILMGVACTCGIVDEKTQSAILKQVAKAYDGIGVDDEPAADEENPTPATD